MPAFIVWLRESGDCEVANSKSKARLRTHFGWIVVDVREKDCVKCCRACTHLIRTAPTYSEPMTSIRDMSSLPLNDRLYVRVLSYCSPRLLPNAMHANPKRSPASTRYLVIYPTVSLADYPRLPTHLDARRASSSPVPPNGMSRGLFIFHAMLHRPN
jgi:hypothetical protein